MTLNDTSFYMTLNKSSRFTAVYTKLRQEIVLGRITLAADLPSEFMPCAAAHIPIALSASALLQTVTFGARSRVRHVDGENDSRLRLHRAFEGFRIYYHFVIR